MDLNQTCPEDYAFYYEYTGLFTNVTTYYDWIKENSTTIFFMIYYHLLAGKINRLIVAVAKKIKNE